MACGGDDRLPRGDGRLDPWQAIGLLQRLRSRGVRVEEYTFSATSVGRLASTLHLLIRNRLLALPDDEELLDELRNVRLRETSLGVVRIDHDADQHDDRAIHSHSRLRGYSTARSPTGRRAAGWRFHMQAAWATGRPATTTPSDR
jgi:hypothetical protein